MTHTGRRLSNLLRCLTPAAALIGAFHASAGALPSPSDSTAIAVHSPSRDVDLISVSARIEIGPGARRLEALATLTLLVGESTDSIRIATGPLAVQRVELGTSDSVFHRTFFAAGPGDAISVDLQDRVLTGDTARVRLTYTVGTRSGIRRTALPASAVALWTVSWPHAWRHFLPGSGMRRDPARVDLLVTADSAWSVVGWPRSDEAPGESAGRRTIRIWSEDEIDVRQVGFVAGEFDVVQDLIFPDEEPIRIRYVRSASGSRLPPSVASVPEITAFFRSRLDIPFPDADLLVAPVADVVTDPISSAYGVLEESAGRVTEARPEHEVILRLARVVAYGWLARAARPSSWEDCWLQLALADYMAMLFLEQDAGTDALAERLFVVRQAYLGSEDARLNPLVRARWDHPMDQMTAGVQARAVYVLHEFRQSFGLEALWDAVRAYLQKPGRGTADDFVRSAEAVGGPPATTFLERWFFRSGHPVIQASYDFDRDRRQVHLKLSQIQEGALVPSVFPMDLRVEIHTLTGISGHRLQMRERDEIYELASEFRPRAVVPDPDGASLAEITVDQEPTAVVFQLRESPAVFARLEAATRATQLVQDPDLLVGLRGVLGVEGRASVRTVVTEAIAAHSDSASVRGYLLDLLADPSAPVRAAAARGLRRFASEQGVARALLALANGDNSVTAQSEAVLSLIRGGYGDRERLLQAALITDSPDDRIRATAVDAAQYMAWPSARKTSFVLDHMTTDSSTSVRIAAVRLAGILGERRTVPALISLLDDSSVPVRQAAAEVLGSFHDSPDRARIQESLRAPNVPEVEWIAVSARSGAGADD